MEKDKKQAVFKVEGVDACKAEADEVKNMMILNAINENNVKKKKN